MKKAAALIVVGASGFVGSKVTRLLVARGLFKILSPSKKCLDITSSDSISTFFAENKPNILVNFASFTDIPKAENQRGQKGSLAWKLNVDAVKKLAALCKKNNIFLIHISTDSVFAGTGDFKGPYREDIVYPTHPELLSWYSLTKLFGELAVMNSSCNFAVVRISYPFGNSDSKKDYIIKTLKYIDNGMPFFNDQVFTPTYIPDLAHVIEAVSKLKSRGVYHVACRGLTTPYLVALYTAKKLGLRSEIRAQSIAELLLNKNSVRRSRLGGLLTDKTESLLNLKFLDWEKAIDDFIHEIS